MAYLCRLHFFRNSPRVDGEISIDNDVLNPDMNLIGSARLRLPMQAARYTFGSGTEQTVSGTVRLLQDHDNRLRLFRHGKVSESEQRAAGFCRVRTRAGNTVTVAVPVPP